MPLLVFIKILKSIIVPLFLYALSYKSCITRLIIKLVHNTAEMYVFVLPVCGIFMALENRIRI